MSRRTLASVPVNVALAAATVFAAAPLAWMVSASFMHAGDATVVPPRFLPSDPTIEHYVSLFTRLDMARHFLNSAFVTTLATVLSVTINSMAGYAFAKLPFGARDRTFRGLTLALVVPAQVGMLPLFLLLRELGLVNTFAGVLVPYLASVFGIFLIRQYALSVPDDLLDAARLDGAGEARVFAMIVVPLIRPILTTLAMFTFLNAWNDFLWPLVTILTKQEAFTLQLGLATFQGAHQTQWHYVAAANIMSMLPLLVLFLLAQRFFVRGIATQGLKG